MTQSNYTESDSQTGMSVQKKRDWKWTKESSDRESHWAKPYHIITVNIGVDADEEFIRTVQDVSASDIPTAILTMETVNGTLISYACRLADKWHKDGLCVIAICKDESEVDETAQQPDIPIEVRLRALKERTNTLIIVQPGSTCREVVSVLFDSSSLCFQNASDTALADWIAKTLGTGGYAYYAAYNRHDLWNTEEFMYQILFESLSVCPFYMADGVLLDIESGCEFTMDIETEDLFGDLCIVTSVLKDHLLTDNVLRRLHKNRGLHPFSANVRLLFWGLEEAHFAFDENGFSQLYTSPDEKLNRRIQRLLKGSVYLTRKKERYVHYFGKNKKHSFS